ncbi:MAG: hypothetical protein V1740_07925 [Candidatus Woesearchaeota archaeon]
MDKHICSGCGSILNKIESKVVSNSNYDIYYCKKCNKKIARLEN